MHCALRTASVPPAEVTSVGTYSRPSASMFGPQVPDCCVAERFGSHLLDVSVPRQQQHALSSGETDFYAIVKDTAQGIQTHWLYEFMSSVVVSGPP